MAETAVKLLQCRIADTGLMRIDRIGAGVGVIFYNAAEKTGAGLHILAPRSGAIQPLNKVMFADTAIPYALDELAGKGVTPPYSIAIAGGATMLGTKDSTNMGQKVVTAVRDALALAHLDVKVDRTGGSAIRSIILDLDAGKISIS